MLRLKKRITSHFLYAHGITPPHSKIDLITDFESFLHKCDLENQELLIMGDLNCDFSQSPADSNTCKLQLLSLLYQLEQLIIEPTRITGTSATSD